MKMENSRKDGCDYVHKNVKGSRETNEKNGRSLRRWRREHRSLLLKIKMRRGEIPSHERK